MKRPEDDMLFGQTFPVEPGLYIVGHCQVMGDSNGNTGVAYALCFGSYTCDFRFCVRESEEICTGKPLPGLAGYRLNTCSARIPRGSSQISG